MSVSYKLNRVCATCNKQISDQNKSGFCNSHRPRSGENNPFFGHTHKPISDETRKKLSKASKRNWQSDEYRKKQKESTIGLKRSDKFKQEQSERVKKQFEDPEQRLLRSKAMTKAWQDGKMTKNDYHINRSKAELELYERLHNTFDKFLSKNSIKYLENNKNKWLFPDAIIFNDTIIEFNGDYWHANPTMYNDDDIINNITAKEIRQLDKERYQKMNKLGYAIIVIWESAWKRDKDRLINDLINLFNWDNYKELDVYEIT